MGGVGRWRFAPATGKKEKPMSVRMALAKLCACTCGGAIIGSGAMQITDVPKARAQVQSCSPCVAKKKVVRKRQDRKRAVSGKSGSVRVEIGGRRVIKKKKNY